MQYIPMITKKDSFDILTESIHSCFYHSFPPLIEKGKLNKFGLLFCVGLTISCFTSLCRFFSKHD